MECRQKIQKRTIIFVVVAAVAMMFLLCSRVMAEAGPDENKVIKVGIIPDLYPLSDCQSENGTFDGINVELMKHISEKTGLEFEYVRIPLEKKTPYEALMDGDFQLAVGTTKTDNFAKDEKVLLSDRLFDGSLVLIGMNGKRIALDGDPLKIAITKGYQAGEEYATQCFPGGQLLFYSENEACLNAVVSKEADVALVSQYVGSYLLQKPQYGKMQVIRSYTLEIDSCIMGKNTPETQRILQIINQGIAQITDQEYSNILMKYTIESPYQVTLQDLIYQYRGSLVVVILLTVLLFILFRKLAFSQREKNRLSYDKLTGAFSEAGFELEVRKVLNTEKESFFLVDFDIYRFERYNEYLGRDQGDHLLEMVVEVFEKQFSSRERIARIYADHFALLLAGGDLDQQIARINECTWEIKRRLSVSIIVNYGIYQVQDPNIPVSKMIRSAVRAKRIVKGNDEKNIAVYDDQIHQKNLEEAEYISSFDQAIADREFFPLYQPKYEVNTGEIVGAEILARWMRSDGKLVMPGRFIEIFEKNGQILKLDFYMLECACKLQRQLLDQEKEAVPISVNFSRVHLFDQNFVSKIVDMVDSYGISHSLIEIECTETTMTEDIQTAKTFFGQLRQQGFAISMDDFGSGYSSLNVLHEISLDIIKLDRGFLIGDGSAESMERSHRIIKNMIHLAMELSLKVVAEGVETREQCDFLREAGCNIIQGYYFSKPVKEEEYVALLEEQMKTDM